MCAIKYLGAIPPLFTACSIVYIFCELFVDGVSVIDKIIQLIHPRIILLVEW